MKLLALLSVIISSATYASGFTFLSSVAHKFHIGEHVLTFSFIILALAAAGLVYRAKVTSLNTAIVPDSGISFRNMIEALGQFVYNLCRDILGEKRAKKYFKAIIFIFFAILFSNLIGTIPGFSPPTTNINTTLALGIFALIYVNVMGMITHGPIGHIKHFAGPVWYLAWLMFPLEILSECIKPVSLALRLRSNMYGDHAVLAIFSSMQEWLVPIPFYALGLLVSCIQAFVFTVLTIVYISLVTEEHHDHGDEGAGH